MVYISESCLEFYKESLHSPAQHCLVHFFLQLLRIGLFELLVGFQVVLEYLELES